MAIRFPLEMKNGVQVRNIDELRENFDTEKVFGYFLDGKLKTWLDARYYEDESAAVSLLNKDDEMLPKKLCEIFSVTYNEDNNFDTERISNRNKRIAKLKQYTDSDEIIQNIDAVAFDQDELSALFRENISKIYLCEGSFNIPESKRDLEYVLFGDALAQGLDCAENKNGNDPEIEEIDIVEPLSVDANASKRFSKAKVNLLNTIKCDGTLIFDDCEIICDSVLKKYLNDSYYMSDSVILTSGGEIKFNNCKIIYVPADDSKHLIAGSNAKVFFDNCSLYDCRNLIGSLRESCASFVMCSGKNMSSPLVSIGGIQSITIKECVFKSVYEKNLSLYDHNLLKPVVSTYPISVEVNVVDTEFEGFLRGIFNSGRVTASHSNFTECGYVFGTEFALEHCNFIKCFEPINAGGTRETSSMVDCVFSECFGKIEISQFVCTQSKVRGGFLSIRGGSSSKHAYKECSFEEINLDLFLGNMQSSRWNFITFSLGEIKQWISYGGRALIDVGGFGEFESCIFKKIDTNNYDHLFTCGNSIDLIECIFEECQAPKNVLDDTTYKTTNLGAIPILGLGTKSITKTVPVQSLFNSFKTHSGKYNIVNCRGI